MQANGKFDAMLNAGGDVDGGTSLNHDIVILVGPSAGLDLSA
jgi:hypothetical protein